MTIESSQQEHGDPRLTAYALGEMDANNRAAFERELEGDPAAQAEVEAIRAFAADVESTLAVPAEEGLDDARREALLSAAGVRRWPLRLVQAAAVLVAVGLSVVFTMRYREVQLADPDREFATLYRSKDKTLRENSFPGDIWKEESDAPEITIFNGQELHLEPSSFTPPKPAGEEPVVRLTVGEMTTAGVLSSRAGTMVYKLQLQPQAKRSGFVSEESYETLILSSWLQASKVHTSTFSIDVDTASYSNVRRFLTRGQLPPPNAVRLEEHINYFKYEYAPPEEGATAPFTTHVQVAQCPWTPEHRLARIGLKGRVVETKARPAANLVFLVDVSGSMEDEDKLPLLKTGLVRLTETLRPDDKVGIVTYAGQAGVALETTPGSHKDAILGAVQNLRAGGSTNGEAGIQVAYDMAAKAKGDATINRVILCTDGDFNVGVSETDGLVQMIEKKAKSGVYLSVLGFGTGNYKDAKMEALSNKGNGNYAYIDGQKEAQRVLVEQVNETLVPIAKDVKVQVFFNPQQVTGYRLLGYENRRLAAREFNDDTKDAGEIGAGHAATALYEIVPAGGTLPGSVDPNPFVRAMDPKKPAAVTSNAMFRLRVRWKAPDGDKSSLIEQDVIDAGHTFEKADRDFQWSASVAAYGMLLRRSPFKGQASWALVSELAQGAKGEDPHGRRAEFLGLVEKARTLHVQR